MNSSLKSKGLTALIVVLVIALISGLAFWLWWGQTRLPFINKAPDFTMQNIEGQAVSLDDSAGKVRIVEFLFVTCPDICPMTTANLVTVQEKLKADGVFGEDVEFIAITFDPERDTPEVLKNYAKGMKMDMSGWEILRDTPENTQKVLDAFAVYAEKQADGTFAHSTTSLFLVDGNNNIRKIYKMGEEMSTDEVYSDIKNLNSKLNHLFE